MPAAQKPDHRYSLLALLAASPLFMVGAATVVALVLQLTAAISEAPTDPVLLTKWHNGLDKGLGDWLLGSLMLWTVHVVVILVKRPTARARRALRLAMGCALSGVLTTAFAMVYLNSLGKVLIGPLTPFPLVLLQLIALPVLGTLAAFRIIRHSDSPH